MAPSQSSPAEARSTRSDALVTAPVIASPTPRLTRVPVRRIVYTVDLQCLMCTRSIGSFECEIWPTYGPIRLQQAPKDHPIAVHDWRRLRCCTCGGSAVPDGIARR